MAPTTYLLAGLLLAATASCDKPKVIPINSIDLAFEPEVFTAEPGDILEFHFLPHNHSVVMGDFDRHSKEAQYGGFFSGFFAPSSGEAVSNSRLSHSIAVVGNRPACCRC